MDYRDENIWLMYGDCLERMKEIPEGSVNLVLTDPPYGTTACKWDSIIPLDEMWSRLDGVAKLDGAIVLFSKEPFTSVMVSSNLKNFKQRLIWEKDNHDNPMQAKNRFLNITEDISVFYKKLPTYNPQGIKEVNQVTRQGGVGVLSDARSSRPSSYEQKYTNYPRNILKFARDRGLHPTQKPVALLEYLIKTYTNEGDTVLDFTAGSMSTAVACINTNRKCIMIEKDEHYYNVGKDRVMKALQDKECILEGQ